MERREARISNDEALNVGMNSWAASARVTSGRRIALRFLGGLLLGHGLFQHAHDVALLHDQEIDSVDLDLGARPLAEQHAVADLEVDWNKLSRLVAAAGADGDDFALRRLLPDGIGNDDATGRLVLGIEALDDDTVVERTKFHGCLPVRSGQSALTVAVVARQQSATAGCGGAVWLKIKTETVPEGP